MNEGRQATSPSDVFVPSVSTVIIGYFDTIRCWVMARVSQKDLSQYPIVSVPSLKKTGRRLVSYFCPPFISHPIYDFLPPSHPLSRRATFHALLHRNSISSGQQAGGCSSKCFWAKGVSKDGVKRKLAQRGKMFKSFLKSKMACCVFLLRVRMDLEKLSPQGVNSSKLKTWLLQVFGVFSHGILFFRLKFTVSPCFLK